MQSVRFPSQPVSCHRPAFKNAPVQFGGATGWVMRHTTTSQKLYVGAAAAGLATVGTPFIAFLGLAKLTLVATVALAGSAHYGKKWGWIK
jgi:hypothetical protein